MKGIKRFSIIHSYLGMYTVFDNEEGRWLSSREVMDLLNQVTDENRELKYKNELLSDELEQCKAVIEKRWSEYLRKRELKYK